MAGSRIVVLIPAFRECATIGRIVEAAARFASVLVVDDCSPDDTAATAQAAGADVLHNEAQQGYQRSLERGFAEAERQGFSHVVTMDADGEHDPALLGRFSSLLLEDGFGLVLGIRPRRQRLAESLMATYVRLRFGVRDILCGMKGYDLRLYQANGGFAHSDSIGTELAINSIRRGARFCQVAVHGRRRTDQPRFDRRLRANFRILWALARLVAEDLRLKRPMA